MLLGDGEIPVVRAVEATAIPARGELAYLPRRDGELSGPCGFVVRCASPSRTSQPHSVTATGGRGAGR